MEWNIALEKEANPNECWMNLQNIMLSETNQTQKDKHYDHT
jgi:hypothetical protein